MSPLHRVRSGTALLHFFADHEDAFRFIDIDFEMLANPPESDVFALLKLLAWKIQQAKLQERPTALERRLEWLRKTAALSQFEASILGLGARRKLFEPWAKFQEAFDGNGNYLRPPFAAQVLGCSVQRAREALGRTGTLVRSGLVEDHRDEDFTVSRFAIDLLRTRASTPSQLEAALLRPAGPSTLCWDDFSHIPQRDLSSDLVKATISRGVGVNILLYGAPGTGKSEFARALADRLDLTAVFVGEADEDGEEPTRAERLAHLSMVRGLTPAGISRLIVVDEADDLMVSAFSDSRQLTSKLWLNQLVESSVTPTIWIVNDASVLGSPIIRRMDLAAQFKLPPRSVRMRVAVRHAAHLGLNLRGDEIAELAALPVPPAVAANALKAACLTGGGTKTAVAAARSVHRAMGKSERHVQSQSVNFDPAISRASVDLVELSNRLSGSPQRRWSMLLSGPPGTGKSAYARYVAAACGLEVLEKKASDLLDMFVGGTERAIARVFEEATEIGALLIFDEADSMLRNRRLADRGWEVSMVNEMLSWMDQHPMPFVATTNLCDTLDRATSRRFLFKLKFEYLDAARSVSLFERTFGKRAPKSLDLLDELTPADFEVVARRASLLGVTNEAVLIAMLQSELEARSNGLHRTIGFARYGVTSNRQ